MMATIDVVAGAVTVRWSEQFCTRCVLSESFPGLTFNRSGECSYCTNEAERVVLDQETVESALKSARRERQPDVYDAVVLYSGGKDSTRALWAGSNAGLRVLAFTLDNGYISTQTNRNMVAVLDALGVDHVYFRPPATLMKLLYRTSLMSEFGEETMKYSTGSCGSCISMVFAAGRRVARGYGVSTLIGGWSPGQMSTSPVVDGAFVDAVIRRQLEPLARKHPKLAAALEPWLAPTRLDDIRLVNPMYSVAYDEEVVVRAISEMGWQRPADTDSCSTNCCLNGFLVVDHIRRYGYHPYAYELAHHVRIGATSRSDAMAKMTHIGVRAATADRVAVDLGLPRPFGSDGQ